MLTVASSTVFLSIFIGHLDFNESHQGAQMKLFLSLLILLSPILANADFKETIISKKTVTLPVDLSTTKLKFTDLGYSVPLVKVIIPQMAEVTLLNHRNVGEDGPCLFTYDTFQVDDVLQDRPEVIDTEFNITLKKSFFISDDVCKVTLTEEIEADIRGFLFQHSLSTAMPDRVAADCI